MMFESSARTAKIDKMMQKKTMSHVALERSLQCGPMNPKCRLHTQWLPSEDLGATHNM